MPVPDPETFAVGGSSDVGQVRQINQDASGEFSDPDSGRRLLVVADGMGGHRGGEVASRTAVDAIGEVFAGGGDDSGELLRSALRAANDRVHRAAREDADLAGMGTTGVCLLFERGGRGWVGHVGDSRAYHLRAGRLEQITDDHSVVGALIRMGQITEEEARRHPQRHEILRAIGTNDDVEVQIAPLDMGQGDKYLLCSDGLTNEVSNAEIAEVLGREAPEDAARVLVQMANLAGGSDNITVLIAGVPGGPEHAIVGSAAPDPTRRTLPTPWRWGIGAGIVILLGWLLLRGL